MDTQQPQSPNGHSSKALYTVIEKPGDRSFWLRIGWANENRDGSFTLKLDALPMNGKLQMRDYTPREKREDDKRGEDATADRVDQLPF